MEVGWKLGRWLVGGVVVSLACACSKERDFGTLAPGESGTSSRPDEDAGGSQNEGGAAGHQTTGGTSGRESTAGSVGTSGAAGSGNDCAPGTFDCNEDPDDGCETDVAPELSVPTLLGPLRGAYTGSLHAPAAANTLRPIVRYATQDESCGTVRYEIQFDDSCLPGALSDCPFDSVEHAGSSAGGSYQPSKDLPVSTTAPVGALYAWRARACDASQRCSEWSAPAHLNVGRVLQDLNGDGYADIIASSNLGTEVYFGGTSVNGKADARLPQLAGSNARASFVGDVNADGFADVAGMVSGYEPCSGYGTVVQVVYGDATASAQRAQVLCRTAGSPSVTTTTLDPGDINGDGFDDLGVSWGFGSTENSLLLFSGGEQVAEEPLAEAEVTTTNISYAFGFGTSQMTSGRGDYDGDTFADIVAAAAGTSTEPARLYAWLGGPSPASEFDATIVATGCVSPRWLAASKDVDGDGRDDWVLVCGTGGDDTELSVLLGGTTSEGSLVSRWTTPLALSTTTPLLDFDGDGSDELIVSVASEPAVIWKPGLSDPLKPARYARYSGSGIVDTGDHNGDGRLDLAFGNAGQVWRASASTSFNVVPTPLSPPADVDGGKIDLRF